MWVVAEPWAACATSGSEWPRLRPGSGRLQKVEPTPLARVVARQLAGLDALVAPLAAERLGRLIAAIGEEGSIYPTVFPDDEDGCISVLWVAGGEKLQADVAQEGDIFVRHVLADGRVRLSCETPWSTAVYILRDELSALSSKTHRANPEWRQLYPQW